jgi:hypothetical protein
MRLLIALATTVALAAIVPAQAQVSGGFAFQMPIYDASGRAVFNGIPRGQDTQVYDFKGRYVGRVIAKAFVDGRTISLLDLHIGCTDVNSAKVALLAPNSADRTRCDLLTPSKPYTVILPLPGTESREPSGVCLRPFGTEETCRWVFLYAQRLYTETTAARALEVGDKFQISNPRVILSIRSCSTLETLRTGIGGQCGTPVSGTIYEVVQKSDDAVCFRDANYKNDRCSWAVLAPNVYTMW